MADVGSSPANPGRNPRVLIVRLGAMGDVIHALPAVAMLRQFLPEAQIGWVIEQRWRELLCAPGTELAGGRGDGRRPDRPPGRPLIDEVHLVDTRAWRKHPFSPAVRREFLSAIGGLRSRHYDCALELQGAIKSALLARLSGAGVVVGFRQPREALARRFYSKLVDGRAAHVIDQNLELVQSWLGQSGLLGGPHPPSLGECGDDAGAPLPDSPALPPGNLLPRHAASEAAVEAKLQSMSLGQAPLAILNPGAGWAAKQWAPARYGELARVLAARGLRSLVNYGPGEQTLAAEVVAASGGAAEALSTTLSEFIALARRAHLFVGGDTGPMHLAALLGVRTVALFGPTEPARNGPYWPASRVLRDAASVSSYSHRRTADPGLEKLSVGQVLAAAEALFPNQSIRAK